MPFKCRETRAEYRRQFYAKWPLRKRFEHLLHKYGLREAEVAQIWFLEQGESCAICGDTSVGTEGEGEVYRSAIEVDHDHYSGLARGLLCAPCNTMVGQFEAYLRIPPDEHHAISLYLEKHRHRAGQTRSPF